MPPNGYHFSRAMISYTAYLYHRFLLSYRDVQKLPFERGINISYETGDVPDAVENAAGEVQEGVQEVGGALENIGEEGAETGE